MCNMSTKFSRRVTDHSWISKAFTFTMKTINMFTWNWQNVGSDISQNKQKWFDYEPQLLKVESSISTKKYTTTVVGKKIDNM